ncbi:hypothetical protein ACIBH1_32545 [Nonomuraea sp. NPDC050663]|uniref:hypothetical protein n=1 Tax=Nonomuraea sp. NPDC050663 TaxID=3364370 RepID=UPI00379864D5
MHHPSLGGLTRPHPRVEQVLRLSYELAALREAATRVRKDLIAITESSDEAEMQELATALDGPRDVVEAMRCGVDSVALLDALKAAEFQVNLPMEGIVGIAEA